MDPLRVLALARVLGAVPPRVLVVGCEPAVLVPPDDERLVMELSPPVRAAARRAVELVETLIEQEVPGMSKGRWRCWRSSASARGSRRRQAPELQRYLRVRKM